jgi:aminoglycoside phosphotransferase (APT) family kinase protein
VALREGLAAALAADAARHGGIVAVQRRPNPHASTVASETVTVVWGDGTQDELFVKYGEPASPPPAAARGGITYEAMVYTALLGPLVVPAPRFRGLCTPGDGSGVWLVTDWVPSARSLASGGTAGLLQAARWLAEFQARTAQLAVRQALPPLRRHETEWFVAWLDGARANLDRHLGRPPWLEDLCARYRESVAAQLQRQPADVVHGELFPANVLYVGGDHPTIVVVDWESTAISLPALDLAALTARWDPASVQECVREYARARLADLPPAALLDELAVARVHWTLRWLAEASSRATEKIARLLRDLRSAADDLRGVTG